MAIFCIKIGENEPPSYSKYHLLSKHGDIIDILLDDDYPGTEVEKHYLCIKIDLSFLTKEQQTVLKASLLAREIDPVTKATIRKRVHRLDIDNFPNLTTINKTLINQEVIKKRNKIDYSIKSLNDKIKIMKPESLSNLEPYIYNKIINKNLVDFPLQEDPVLAARQHLLNH